MAPFDAEQAAVVVCKATLGLRDRNCVVDSRCLVDPLDAGPYKNAFALNSYPLAPQDAVVAPGRTPPEKARIA